MTLSEERNPANVYADEIEKYANEHKIYNIDLSGITSVPATGTYIISFRIGGSKREHHKFDNLVKEWAKKNNKIVTGVETEEIGYSDGDSYEADHIAYIAEDNEAAGRLRNFSRMFVREKYETTRKNNAKLYEGKRNFLYTVIEYVYDRYQNRTAGVIGEFENLEDAKDCADNYSDMGGVVYVYDDKDNIVYKGRKLYKESIRMTKRKRLRESLSSYEGYLKTAQSAGLPMIFGYTKRRAGNNKYYVNLELICGKDYVDDPVTGYESIGWVDKDNWVKDAQDYLFMWYTDEQSWEDFLEDNDVVELDDRDLPHMVWKYDPRKDRYDRISFSKYVNLI